MSGRKAANALGAHPADLTGEHRADAAPSVIIDAAHAGRDVRPNLTIKDVSAHCSTAHAPIAASASAYPDPPGRAIHHRRRAEEMPVN